VQALEETLRVNFEGQQAVTAAFLPLLAKSRNTPEILSTSSGVGTRTLGLLTEAHRSVLTDPSLDVPTLRQLLWELAEASARVTCARIGPCGRVTFSHCRNS
jgi:hypothetical protein